jgi:predicted amidohydrolase
MRVHLLQMDLAWEDKPANFAAVRRLLDDAQPTPGDLVVLPEMFDTGFSFHVERTADTDDQTANFLSNTAREHRVTLHGARTVMAPDDHHGLNRAHILAPTGEPVAAYDKLHPFSYGREAERFVRGDRVVTYTWFGDPDTPAADASLVVSPAICYDLRFPELFRAGLDLGAHAFALGANWPSARQSHWRALAIARAIENQAFVFAVNRVGADPKLRYDGGSLVVSPRGDVLAEADADETVLTADIDPAMVRAWRDEFPAWRDRADLLRDWRPGSQAVVEH